MAKLIDSDFIRTHSIDEIFASIMSEYNEELEYCKKKDEEREQEIARFKEKYPFCYTDVDKMTDDEKQELYNVYVAKKIETALYRGVSSKEVTRITEKYANTDIKTLAKTDFEHMQTRILKEEPTRHYYVEDLQKQHQICYFKISKKDLADREFMSKFKEYCAETLNRGLQIRVLINDPMIEKANDTQVNYLYSSQEMQDIIELNNHLTYLGMNDQIRFDEYRYMSIISSRDFETCWTVDDVIQANSKIDKIVEKIKEKKISPFETMVFIHKLVTQRFEYKEGTNAESCRVLPGIFKNQEIVCSGYASMVKAIIDRLNIPELSCDIVGCEIYDKSLALNLEGAHCHNLVHIKDEKYGIDGTYMEDACWDSKSEDYELGRGFAHCLYPVDDLEHFRDFHYVQRDKESRLASLIFDPEQVGELMSEAAQLIKAKKKRTETKISQYIKRKNEVKYGADVVKKYGGTSQPIQIEDYEKALRVIFDSYKFYPQGEIDEYIDDALEMSQVSASREFDKKSKSSFVSEKYSKHLKGKTGLKENDGRTLE